MANVARLFPLRGVIDSARLCHCGSNARNLEAETPKPHGRRRIGRSTVSRKLTVLPVSAGGQIRRSKMSNWGGLVPAGPDEKTLAKAEMQADILEKYCGSRSYAPVVPPKSTKKLLKRPRNERHLVGAYLPVRQRRDTLVKLTKDPYLINDKYVHNKHLPVTEDQMQFLKADKFYALPDLYDRKDLPPYLRQPTTDLLIPKRISGGALFLLTLLAQILVIFKIEAFEEDFQWIRQGLRDYILRTNPVDFLPDDILEEFRQREQVAAEIAYNSPESVVKREERLEKQAQEVYQKSLVFQQPPPLNPPLLSKP